MASPNASWSDAAPYGHVGNTDPRVDALMACVESDDDRRLRELLAAGLPIDSAAYVSTIEHYLEIDLYVQDTRVHSC